MLLIAQARNGEQAVDLFRAHRPDVTLMDLRMPGMSGVTAIAAIRSEFADGRFLVLATDEGDEEIYLALRAGAQAYLLKDVPCSELLEAIRTAHAGSTSPPGEGGIGLRDRRPSPRWE